MQGLVGKNRAMSHLSADARMASFLNGKGAHAVIAVHSAIGVAASLLIEGPMISRAIAWGAVGGAFGFFYAASIVNQIERRLLVKCVGRPRIANALAEQFKESDIRPAFESLSKLTRLNLVQKDLLKQFLTNQSEMSEEDQSFAIRLLNRYS